VFLAESVLISLVAPLPDVLPGLRCNKFGKLCFIENAAMLEIIERIPATRQEL
jgi:hypothetical protein